MKKILKLKKTFLVISIIFLIVALCGFILCSKYGSRDWNSSNFETFYALWDFHLAYILEAIGLIIFILAFIFSSKSVTNTFCRILTWASFIGVSLGMLAVLITCIANCVGIDKVIKNYKLDCQLESSNQQEFYEAVDNLIAFSTKNVQYHTPPDPFILKAARSGYDKAQNAIGCFYHERAKNALWQADYENERRGKTNDFHNFIAQSESDFDHSIYWFLKSAQNNFAAAQTNLGRIFMGDLASNRLPDINLAKNWLLKACNYNYPDAFYYLGEIYSKENLRDAYVYWSKGAELGNEDCTRALEKPEFANGIPEDKRINEAVLADTISNAY